MLLFGGLVALAYLALLCRASVLDGQLVSMDQKLAEARFASLQAKRAVIAELSTIAAADSVNGATSNVSPISQETVPCPVLPPLEPCVLTEVVGYGSAAVQTASRDQPKTMGGLRVARRDGYR